MRDPAPLISEEHERVLGLYGDSLGRPQIGLTTPALVVERQRLERNLEYMESRLPGMHARLRGHIKNHKSPHIARLQLAHGAFGLCTATIWEAIIAVMAGADDVLVANELAAREKRRAAALLARQANLIVNVDDLNDIDRLSEEAVRAGSTIGILVELDTGMHRCGADSADEALRLARHVEGRSGLRFDGLSGYEGHCALELDRNKRHAKQIRAIELLVQVADYLEASGIPCRTVSAGGTATAFWTGANPRITELQLGSYATMDDYHALMEPSFEIATAAMATVISRRKDRVVVDIGKKTFGSAEVARFPVHPRLVGFDELRPYRFDEEHSIYDANESCPLRVGDVVRMRLGYTPYAVNYFDAYYVVENDQVVDIWPIMPRGPLHHGLLDMLERGCE